MFHKIRNEKEKEIDITSLNHILRVGKNLINIGYFMAIVCIILLGTYLLKEWNIFKYIGELFVVISPIFIGFIIAWLFEPLVSKIQSKKVPRVVVCILVYLLILGILFLFFYLLVPSLLVQIKDFVEIAPSMFEHITDFIVNLIDKLNLDNLVKVDTLKEAILERISDWGLSIGSELPKYLLSVGKKIVNGGFNFALGLMIGFYLLYDFDKVSSAIYSVVPRDWKNNYSELMHRINTSLRSYVQGVLLVMLLVFITQTIGLTIAGMEAPILFAMFCAITDIIPYFGPYIGAIPAIIVGFTISPITGICVIVSILVVQALENNFYQPLIMGHTMKLHPVTIMVGLLIFQHFFGILGMVLATPCIACLKVIVNFIFENTTFHLERKKISNK